MFAESISLRESAEWNPYGHIGLAASLRRKGRYEEAWDTLKRPLRYYPDNEYALRVKSALVRDLGIGDAAYAHGNELDFTSHEVMASSRGTVHSR